MRLKAIAGIMLTLLVVNMLAMAFIVAPIGADTGVVGAPGDYPTMPEADGDHLMDRVPSWDSSWYDGSNNQGFNETNEWMNLACSDDDSLELAIGINNAQPNSYAKLEKLITKNGGEIVNTVSMSGEIRAAVADMPFAAMPNFLDEVQAAGLSRYVEPNMKFQATFVPNDPYWQWQWGPKKIEADYAWNTTIGDPSVLVAVIDTGVDWNHPDLAANYVALGYDWVNNDTDPMDDHGHGTHCAGIIAAVLNNGRGIAGLAQVRIMAEKGLDWGGWGYEDDLANAIIHAVDAGADILSNSWGGYGESVLIHEAVEYACTHGVLVIAAAGNDATSMKLYPAAYDEVVAVTATDESDYPAWWTNFGDWVELAAPGVNIYSTVWNNNYTYMSGTSMATPHVAGVAALIWSRFPNATGDWLRLWLRYTADDLGDPGFDVYYGYGRINARRAIEEAPPEHDLLIVSQKTLPYVEPNSTGTVNTTVLNFGASDESNIAVQLLVNGSLVDSALISFLATGTSVTVECLWSPAVEGKYNVTSYVVLVPNETLIENNVVSAYVYVGFPVKVFVLDSAGTDIPSVISTWQILNTNWHVFGDTLIYIDYASLNKDDITYDDIAATGADVLIISCAYDPWMGWEFTDSEIDAITRYVLEGHGLIATSGTLYYSVPNNNKLAPLFGISETITCTATGTDWLDILDAKHPLFVNVPDPYTTPYVGTAVPSDGRWDLNELIGGEYLALGYYQESAIVAYRGLVYISPLLEAIPPRYHFHLQLLYNAMTWTRYQKPEHELVVSLESPKSIKPGGSALLNATVSNVGLSNETNVELQLLIDGSVVNSTTIPQLVNGTSYTISCLWAPTVEKIYNVTAYAPPVPNEDNTLNNIRSRKVTVSSLLVALFKNLDPWGYPANEEALSAYGIEYVVFSSSDFGLVDLSSFSKVVIASDQDQAFYNAMDAYRWWFDDYASGGGILEIHAACWGWQDGGWVGTLPGGLQWVSYYGDYVTIVDPTHPVVTTPNPIADAELDYWWWSVHGYFSNYPAHSRVVIIEDSTGYPAYLEFNYGAGVILASSQTLEWAYWTGYSLMLENSLLYAPIKREHELAVTLEAPTFLEPGDSSLLKATVHNRGLSNETDVELYLLINGMIVNNATILELVEGTYYTIDYLWTPPVEATYNVTAYALPVPGETVTGNNIATKMVNVRSVVGYILFDQTHQTDSITYYSIWVANLTGRGYLVDTHISGSITPKVLVGYDVFVIPQAHDYYSSDELSAIRDFVLNGGGLLVIGDDMPYIYANLTSFAGITWSWESYGWWGYTSDITLHQVTEEVNTAYFSSPVSQLQVSSPAIDLIRDGYGYGEIMLAVSEIELGRVIGIADEHTVTDYLISYADNFQLANNMIDWLKSRQPIASITYSPHDPFVGETVTFDASASYDPDGTIVRYIWDFGDDTSGVGGVTTHMYAASGNRTVTLTVVDNEGLKSTATTEVTVLGTTIDVQMKVGSIHFRGEIAEFYVLVSSLGKPIDAKISATLYYNGKLYENLNASIEHVSLGLYRIPYTIPLSASTGTYALVVEASYLTLRGTSLESFLLSPTLTGWNAVLVSINGTVGTLKTDVGLIKVDISNINARLASLNNTVATIQTDIGSITADIANIHLNVTAINGTVVTIQTMLGALEGWVTSMEGDMATIETDIGTIKTILEGWSGTTSTITTPAGSFQILVLTTSTLEGTIAFSDNVLVISLSGSPGTTGRTNVVIPKQLLLGIESSLDKVVVTLDNKQVAFTYTEQSQTYVLQINYTHSVHLMKVYLTGLPLTPLPTWIIAITVLIVAVATSAAFYILIRKQQTASAPKSTTNLGF